MAIDEHKSVEMLLPWFVTDRLDHDEMGRVERHLERCDACRHMVLAERRLKDSIAALDVPPLPIAAPLPGSGRERAVAQLIWSRSRRAVAAIVHKPARAATMVAAQTAVLLIAFQVGQTTASSRSEYQLLSSDEAVRDANMIVMFDESTREAELRAMINEVGGTIVGGPTGSDAYLLHVDEGSRDGAVVVLQRKEQVELAQPVDAR